MLESFLSNHAVMNSVVNDHDDYSHWKEDVKNSLQDRVFYKEVPIILPRKQLEPITSFLGQAAAGTTTSSGGVYCSSAASGRFTCVSGGSLVFTPERRSDCPLCDCVSCRFTPNGAGPDTASFACDVYRDRGRRHSSDGELKNSIHPFYSVV